MDMEKVITERLAINKKILWILDTRCNLNCPHCYVHSREWQKKLTRERGLKLIEEARELGIEEIDFSGGEALLIPETIDYLKKARELGLRVSLNSNGLLFNNDNLKLLKELEVYLYLSIDGATKEAYERIRGIGNYDLLLSKLKLLEQYGLKFSLLFTLSSINQAEAKKMVSFAQKIGAEALCLIPVIPSGQARKTGIWIDSSLVIKAIGEISEEAEKLNYKVVVLDCPYLKILPLSRNLVIEPCPSFEIIDLSPAGDILMCDVLDIPLSEIRSKSLKKALKEIINHPLYQTLQERAKVCQECPESDFCRAGCYARSYLCLGDIKQPDPFCPHAFPPQKAPKN